MLQLIQIARFAFVYCIIDYELGGSNRNAIFHASLFDWPPSLSTEQYFTRFLTRDHDGLISQVHIRFYNSSNLANRAICINCKILKLQSRSQITSLLSLLSVNNMATVSKNVIILKTRVCEPVTVPAENQKRCSNTSPHKRVNKSYHIRIALSCVERNF